MNINNKSNNISFVVPHLNEDIAVFNHTLQILLNSAIILDIQYEILIFDGGSDKKLFYEMKAEVDALKNSNIKLYFPFPITTQNKNAIIKNCSKLVSNDVIFIIDSDIVNLSEKIIIDLYNILLKKEYNALIPQFEYLYGRDNYLIGNPILRLFFPDISKQTSSPLPGFLVIKKEILNKIINQNYFIDWGGEIQNLIDSYYFTEKRIAFPSMGRKQEKHRALSSKTIDSYQMYRAGFALAAKYDRINLIMHHSLESYIKLFPVENEMLTNFLGVNNYLSILSLFKTLEIEKIIEYFLLLYNKTHIYEYVLFIEMIIIPINFIISGIKYSIKETINTQDIDVNLKSFSFLCDLFILSIIKQNKKAIKNRTFNDWMFCILPYYTCLTPELKNISMENMDLNIYKLSNREIDKILDFFHLIDLRNILNINKKILEQKQ